jgi:hypothetical protein
MRIYVDGAKVLDLPGSIPSSKRPTRSGSSSWATGSFCHVSVRRSLRDDTDHRLGERKITVLTPTADVAKAFTPSTGTDNYACLDEAVPDTTDYVTATDPGPPTPMNCPIWSTPAVIDAIQLTAMARKTDAATRALALQVVSGGTVDDGPNLYLSSSFTPVSRILPTTRQPARPGPGSGQRPARRAQGHGLMADEYVVASLPGPCPRPAAGRVGSPGASSPRPPATPRRPAASPSKSSSPSPPRPPAAARPSCPARRAFIPTDSSPRPAA